MRRKKWLLASVFVLLLTAALVVYLPYPEGRRVPGYRGDGTCTTVTAGDSLVAHVLTRGYLIDFGSIELGKVLQAHYSIDNLPSPRMEPLNFHIDVSGNGLESGKALMNKLRGRLTMRLQVRNGKEVFNCSAPVGDWTVMEGGSRPQLEVYWFDDHGGSTLRKEDLKTGTAYDLFVTYEPAPGDAPLIGKVRAQAGGVF